MDETQKLTEICLCFTFYFQILPNFIRRSRIPLFKEPVGAIKSVLIN